MVCTTMLSIWFGYETVIDVYKIDWLKPKNAYAPARAEGTATPLSNIVKESRFKKEWYRMPKYGNKIPEMEWSEYP